MELLALAALGGVAWFLWGREAVGVVNLADRIDKATPPRIAQWARELAAAALATQPAAVDLWTWATTVAAVLDRESNGGLTLKPRGPGGRGDNGHGLGLMQLDIGSHPGLEQHPELWGNAAWNIMQGARELALHYGQAEAIGALDPARRLEYAIARYNSGSAFHGAGDPNDDPNLHTTGGDYASDVLARADAFAASSSGTPA